MNSFTISFKEDISLYFLCRIEFLPLNGLILTHMQVYEELWIPVTALFYPLVSWFNSLHVCKVNLCKSLDITSYFVLEKIFKSSPFILILPFLCFPFWKWGWAINWTINYQLNRNAQFKFDCSWFFMTTIDSRQTFNCLSHLLRWAKKDLLHI